MDNSIRLRHYKEKSIPSQWVQIDESYPELGRTSKSEYVVSRIGRVKSKYPSADSTEHSWLQQWVYNGQHSLNGRVKASN